MKENPTADSAPQTGDASTIAGSPDPSAAPVEHLIDDYDRGRLSRRQLLAGIAALTAVSATGTAGEEPPAAKPSGPTFQATSLNHIALRVTDLDRSEAFYRQHLGLRRASGGPYNRFLDCGPHFVALFRANAPGLDHFCFSLPGYTQQDAAARLRAAGLEPELHENRTYFRDPDGIQVQLARP